MLTGYTGEGNSQIAGVGATYDRSRLCDVKVAPSAVGFKHDHADIHGRSGWRVWVQIVTSVTLST